MKAIIKRSDIQCILCATALVLCICMSGGIMWHGCILPLILLIIVSITASPSKTGLAVMLLIIIFSAVPVFFTDGDRQTALHELLKLCLLPMAFAAGSTLKNGKGHIILFAGILTAAAGLILYTGIIPGEEWTLNDRGIIRLQSLLRYANTAAVIMGAAYYIALEQYARTENKLYTAVSAVICFAMWLTLSKAVLVLYLVIGIGFVVINKSCRRLFIVENGICILMAAVIFLCHRDYDATQTLVKRIIYYKDALTLLKSHAFIGIAPGAWRYYQYSVQSADYNVTYLHNGWLQLWLENGIVPFMLFAFMSARAISTLIRHKAYAMCAGLLLILLHSFTDIDLSFGAVLIIIGFIMSECGDVPAPRGITVSAAVLITAIALYGATEYAMRLRFERACTTQSVMAAEYGKELGIICPWDSRLRVTLAVLEPENAMTYIDEASRLSPLDLEIREIKLDMITQQLKKQQ